MPAKRRGKAVLIPSSPAYSFGTGLRPRPSAATTGNAPGPGTYNVHGESLNAPPKGSKAPVSAILPNHCPAHSMNSADSDSKNPVNPKHPAFVFTGSSVPDSRAGDPGPGTYNWGPNADKLHPNVAEPVSMKFRRAIPSDKTRRPGPDEYSPMDRLSIYKGEYTKCTMKFRSKGKLIKPIPDPGPGEYNPTTTTGQRAPKYTIRLKLASQLDPPPFPGPGAYDVESSTIGNWGAGMAVHIPESPDIFLNERIEFFRRGAAPSPEHGPFLEQNRMKLMELRRQEIGHGTPGKGSKAGKQHGTGKGAGKGRSKNGGKAQTIFPGANNGVQASGLLVEQHLYDTN